MKSFREAGAIARGINVDLERRSWTRAIAAKAMSIGRNEDGSNIIKAAWPSDDRALAITRGAVTPLTSAGYPTFDPITSYRSLAPASAALALFQLGTALNLDGVTTIRIPAFASLPVQPVFVGEGLPAPVVEWNFDASTVLGPARKILMLSAVTEELESANPDAASAVIGRVIADVANRGIDSCAFDTNTATNGATVAKPASLLHTATAITATAGGSVDAMTSDLGNLVNAIGAAGIDTSGVVFVCGPQEAMTIKIKVGFKFDYPVLTTLGLPPKAVAAFAPEGIFSGYQDAPTIETRKSPDTHFEGSNPTDISFGSGVAAPVKSGFQAGLIYIRVRAHCAWAVANGAAQYITGVTW